jgi:hypothetical protein
LNFFAHYSRFSHSKISHNNSFQHRTFGAGQPLSRSFVVLLRKSIPQSRNLKAAAELYVMSLMPPRRQYVWNVQEKGRFE